MSDNKKNLSSKILNILSLPEIAAWQIADDRLVQAASIVAGLPALQRGAVWKTQQVEEIWDSLIQGFPVGAFLVSPIIGAKDLGTAKQKYQEEGISESTHYLLDGQQRATAIALGYLDLWRDGRADDDKVKGALWVDLAVPPQKRDVEFVFRALTKAHPWGYMRDYQRPTLHLKQTREWLYAYSIASGHHDQKISEILLKDAWPWDAIAPIPVALLIRAAKEAPADIAKQGALILKYLTKTTFWNVADAGVQNLWHCEQQASVKQALESPTSELFSRFKLLMEAIENLQSVYGIPVQILDINKRTMPDDGQEQNERADPVETLFVRINSKVTPLQGEELIYSMLKAAWSNAPIEIEKIRHKMLTPSRLVLFCARLVLARYRTSEAKLPSAPSVRDFRRLMRGLDRNHKTFSDDLKGFISGGASGGIQGGILFEKAHEFLTVGEYSLPPVLATELAQQAPEVFFLLLRWLDLLHIKGSDAFNISDDRRQKALGFLTALAWFSPDRGASAVLRLWADLNNSSEIDIDHFFDSRRFGKLLKIDERGVLPMIPLISPDDLKLIIERRVLENIENQKSDLWGNWDIWKGFSETLPEQVRTLFQAHLENQSEDIYKGTWHKFISTKLWSNHSVLLYAQRHWMIKWFNDFDPSQPECLEDKNRPWDYDHIHPQNFLQNDSGNPYHNIPQIIKVWHRSIGNLRAWPLEANRADSDSMPSNKLTEFRLSNIERRYYMNSESDLRNASFIADDWLAWQASALDQSDFYYLLKESDQRVALIRAITTRFVRIYNEWYQSLRIAELMRGD